MTRRGNGFGTLVCKGKGKPWLGRWVFHGKVFYKSTGEVDKKKALKALERLTRPFRDAREEDAIRNLQNKLIQLQERKTKTTLPIDDLWEEFAKKLKNKDLESGSKRVYESDIKHLTKWMKKKTNSADGITSTLAEEYLACLSSEIGAATYNRRLVLFKRIWKELSSEFMLSKDVWENFTKKKATRASRCALSSKELAKIISTAETHDMKLLLIIGMYTGLRISDCALLKWSDIDFEKNLIRVVPIKTKKHMDTPIEIPLHPTLLKMLNETPRNGEYASEANARAYSEGRLSGEVVKLLKDCGLETSRKVDGKTKLLRGFHSLRHTFVSTAINSGMSAMLVQKIVGHSAVNMTEVYYHDNIDKMIEGINALPDIMQLVGKN